MISESATRQELARLAGTMPVVDVIDGAIRIARRRRHRQRSLLLLGTSVVVAAAVAIPISVRSTAHTVVLALPPHPSTEPANGVDHAFDVAPSGASWGGSTSFGNQPVCRVDQVRGSAVTRTTPRGVVGVISLRAHDCRLKAATATSLVGLDSTPLGVRKMPIPTLRDVNFGNGNPSALFSGKADVGFAWKGSWCGAPAHAVAVSIGAGTIDVPLGGPQPTCSGNSDSELIPGTVNFPGSPVQTAPLEWTALSAAVQVTGPNTHDSLRGVEVDFTNPTGQPIALNPIPTYLIGVEDTNGDGTPGAALQPLPYPASRLIVPAHGTLRLGLPDVDLSADSDNFVSTEIHVSFSIAGVPFSTTTTQVPR